MTSVSVDSTFTKRSGSDEELFCCLEDRNLYAVAVLKAGEDSLHMVISHVPRKISVVYNLFISLGGNISCTITGFRF